MGLLHCAGLPPAQIKDAMTVPITPIYSKYTSHSYLTQWLALYLQTIAVSVSERLVCLRCEE